LAYVTCYAVYALLLALSVVALLIWRAAILVLIATLIGPSHTNSAVYDFSLVALGLCLFGLAIAAEPYLRNGVKQGRLLPRATRLSIPLGLLILLGLLLVVWV
jgi:hypothetical protein